MSMAYIRKYYGVPAKRGGRVEVTNATGVRRGTIASATHYVFIRIDGDRVALPYHPNSEGLRYL